MKSSSYDIGGDYDFCINYCTFRSVNFRSERLLQISFPLTSSNLFGYHKTSVKCKNLHINKYFSVFYFSWFLSLYQILCYVLTNNLHFLHFHTFPQKTQFHESYLLQSLRCRCHKRSTKILLSVIDVTSDKFML